MWIPGKGTSRLLGETNKGKLQMKASTGRTNVDTRLWSSVEASAMIICWMGSIGRRPSVVRRRSYSHIGGAGEAEQKLSAWQLAFERVEDVNAEDTVVNDINIRRCDEIKWFQREVRMISGRSEKEVRMILERRKSSRLGNERKVR